MKFSSASLITAALLFLPAASSVSVMPKWDCDALDNDCIENYSNEWSVYGDEVGEDYSAQSDACNALEDGSQESIDCWLDMSGGAAGAAKDMVTDLVGSIFSKSNNDTSSIDDADVTTTTTDPSSMSVVPGASGAVSSPFKDMTVVSSSSAASTTTSLAAAISLVTAATATVMVVA